MGGEVAWCLLCSLPLQPPLQSEHPHTLSVTPSPPSMLVLSSLCLSFPICEMVPCFFSTGLLMPSQEAPLNQALGLWIHQNYPHPELEDAEGRARPQLLLRTQLNTHSWPGVRTRAPGTREGAGRTGQDGDP